MMNPQRSTTIAGKRSTYANRTKSVVPAKRITTAGRKTSLAGTGQNRRRSSTTGNELRPVAEIKNKAMLRRQIERINAFLDSQQATDEVPRLGQEIPSIKNYIILVEYMYTRLPFECGGTRDPFDPTTPKDVELLKNILELLGCPIKFTNQQLKIITPQSWYQFIAVLVWVAEEVEKRLEFIKVCLEESPSPKDALSDLQMKFAAEAYAEYMSGADIFTKAEADFDNALDQQLAALRESIKTISVERDSIESEIIKHGDPQNALDKVKESLRTVETDISKFTEYLGQCKEYKTALTQHIKTTEAEQETVSKQIIGEESVVRDLERTIKSQKMSRSECEKINREMTLLQNSIMHQNEQKSKIDQRNWTLEKEMETEFDSISAMLSNYEALSQNVRIVPESAKYANKKNMRLEWNKNGMTKDEEEGMLKRIRDVIRPELAVLSKRFDQKKLKQHSEANEMKRVQTETSQKLLEAKQRSSDEELKFQKAKDEFEANKRAWEADAQTLEEKIAAIVDEARVKLAEATKHKDDAAAEERELAEKLTRLLETQQQIKQSLFNRIARSINVSLTHQEQIQEMIDSVAESVNTANANIKQAQLPSTAL